MIIGDSVVNGGAQTDQGQLATSILQQRLREKVGQDVIVGNISAGSWGPVNMLAYVKKFGLFDADVVVIVLSSHDYGDAPAIPFKPVVGIQPEFPDHKPLLALQELVLRYLLPRLRGAVGNASVPADRAPEPDEVDRSLKALSELIEMAQRSRAKVIVAQYLERKEIDGALLPGHDMIESLAREHGAEVVQLGPAQRASLMAGKDPFRDALHPNATGQQRMADALFEPIEKELESN
jgi:lysophospholipase L1-like esterase